MKVPVLENGRVRQPRWDYASHDQPLGLFQEMRWRIYEGDSCIGPGYAIHIMMFSFRYHIKNAHMEKLCCHVSMSKSYEPLLQEFLELFLKVIALFCTVFGSSLVYIMNLGYMFEIFKTFYNHLTQNLRKLLSPVLGSH